MILVTGATGTLGRPLVEALAAEGGKVRAVTRAAAAAAVLPANVEVVVGDPSRPETLADCLDGVSAVFMHSRAVGDGAFDLAELARDRGVRRLVALSAMNVDEDLAAQPSRYRGDRNKETEAAAAGSGLDWVSLRAGSFAINALWAWGAQIRAGDIVRGPFAAFTEAPLDERDLVAVAARALLTDTDDLMGRRGRRIDLTGPGALSHADMVAAIGVAIGRPLRYEQIPPEVARKGMVANGLPEPFVAALMDRYAREGRHVAPISGDVQRILGRPARPFAQWAADHANAFRA